jgi:cytidylate kinase
MDSGPRHILIYGPPAAGKLTVANRLAELYDLRVVDNHASIDPALRLFYFGTREFADLVEEIRVALISAAARARLDIASTLVYAHGVDEHHVARLSEATTRHGGTMHFVQLRPPDEILESRVAEAARAATKKIASVDQLRRTLERYDLTTPVSEGDLRIDNSDIAPDVVARAIGRAFQLHERP